MVDCVHASNRCPAGGPACAGARVANGAIRLRHAGPGFRGWGGAMRPAHAAVHSSSVISRYLSRVLRHEPQGIGLSLDTQGWAHIDDLVEHARAHGMPL